VYVFGKLRGRVLAGLSDVGGGSDESGDSGEGESESGGESGQDEDGSASRRRNEPQNNQANNEQSSSSSSSNNNNKPSQQTTTKSQQQHSNNHRIYATSFDPELVCIGNVFQTVDDGVASLRGLENDGEEGAIGPAMVRLDENGELLFERMEL